ncbi:RNA 2'-phosphotransferase [Nocardioides sp. YIM 152588]|uniref:RNA 2'-phosphotransferase n=1 Tax=Nocardioides sp. YIM 152588 TaxID=3158259 RepID=UPI0032E440C7
MLQSRHGDFSSEQAAEMADRIKDSIAHGNNNADSLSYLAEALLRLNDKSGEYEPLKEIVDLAKRLRGAETEALASHIAEAWLRLSQAAETEEGRARFRDRADAQRKSISNTKDPVVAARSAIVGAYLRLPQDRVPEIQGLRTPFGIASQAREWRLSDRGIAREILREIDQEFARLPAEILASPLLRSIAASTKSELASLYPARAVGQKAELLKSAVSLRSWSKGQQALRDPDSRLQNAIDRFELYKVTGHRAYLLEAIGDALSLTSFDQAWATPLLVLARELEALPDGVPHQVAYELQKESHNGSRDILRDVLSRNLAGLYSTAAKRALESREIDRKRLGGRSGVYLAEDPSGVISETFVFKPTLNALADRELERVTNLEKHLKQMGLSRRYSVPATLAKSPLPPDDVLRTNGCEVLVARRFHTGEILPDALRAKNLAARSNTLETVVKYLAVIHATEHLACTIAPTSVRRDLLRKDFGRWLKNGLQLKDAADVFDRWWNLFGSEPVFLPRRDAHPLNWLIGADRAVVAVDFEACGWRPAGLELAQLLDDRPLLPVDSGGWDARLHLLRQYRRELSRRGVAISHVHLLVSWEAATVSRAVGLLTSPDGNAELRQHGEALLLWLGDKASSLEVRKISTHLLHAWSVRRGVAVDEKNQLKGISDARRRHLSRAMAYELRHGDTVFLDRGGWAYIAAVSDALYRNGLGTDSVEVRTVAAAIDEPRFELRGKKIRARYGHTRPVDIEYAEAVARPTLFHGTASDNLRSILSDGAGLTSMGRQWVHLSSDPHLALRTARRHGPGVLLAIDAQSECGPVFHAGGAVYLASAVPASSLRIVSPTEMFLRDGTVR